MRKGVKAHLIQNKTNIKIFCIDITMNPPPIQTGNGMMDMLKTQLMTMTMVSSMNGNEKTGNFFNVIYIFLATLVLLNKNIRLYLPK
jgi:hypothetical protein